MEEIKIFANAARQVYEAALQEARQKKADQSRLKGAADQMADAKKTLTQAAQDVEGPAATADGYMPSGEATSSPTGSSASILNVTA